MAFSTWPPLRRIIRSVIVSAPYTALVGAGPVLTERRTELLCACQVLSALQHRATAATG